MGLADFFKGKKRKVKAKDVLRKTLGQKESYTRPAQDYNTKDERAEETTRWNKNKDNMQAAKDKAVKRAAAKRRAAKNKKD